jgi:hypothetical protein
LQSCVFRRIPRQTCNDNYLDLRGGEGWGVFCSFLMKTNFTSLSYASILLHILLSLHIYMKAIINDRLELSFMLCKF